MILGDPRVSQTNDRATLDDIFRGVVARRPDAIAVADPPNRESFTEAPPRRVSYAEADRMVSAIAGRLRRLGLPTDAVVGLQLANTVESTLAVLGVLRAGMIAAPLPLLWRRRKPGWVLRVSISARIICYWLRPTRTACGSGNWLVLVRLAC